MPRPFRLLAWLIPLLLVGCSVFTQYGQLASSGRRSFVQGHLDDAVLKAVQALRVKPDYPEAQTLLADAFPLARRRHLDTIEALKARSATFANDETVADREQIVNEYEALVHITQEASSLPPYVIAATGDVVSFPYEDYNTLLAEATASLRESRQAAAAMHYQRGLDLRKLTGKEAARLAAAAFKQALGYVPNYRDAQLQYNAAREAGTVRVGVLCFVDATPWRRQVAADDRLPYLLSDALAAHAGDYEFTRFVHRVDLDRLARSKRIDLTRASAGPQEAAVIGHALGLDQVVVGHIRALSVSPAKTSRESWDDSVEIPQGYTTYTGKDGKIYQTQTVAVVSARVNHYTRQAQARYGADYQLVDVHAGTDIASGNHDSTAAWSTEWATYSGDQRALSDRSRELVAKSEGTYPGDRALVNAALADLVKKLDAELVTYFR